MNLFSKYLLLIWLICLPTLFFTFNQYKNLNTTIDFDSELKLGKQSYNIISNSQCIGNFTMNFIEEELSTYKIDITFLFVVKAKDLTQNVRFESALQFNPFLQLASTSSRLKFSNYAITLTSFGIEDIDYTLKFYDGQNVKYQFKDKFNGPFELKQVAKDTFILSNFNSSFFEKLQESTPELVRKQALSFEASETTCEPKGLDITGINLQIDSLLKFLK